MSVPWVRHEADAPDPLREASSEAVGTLGGILGEAVVASLVVGPGGGSRADWAGRVGRAGAGELSSRGAAAAPAVAESSGSPEIEHLVLRYSQAIGIKPEGAFFQLPSPGNLQPSPAYFPMTLSEHLVNTPDLKGLV